MLKTNRRGQIASLDFILSLILLTLALGTVIRYTEMQGYYLKGEELDLKLQKSGRAASEILMNSQDFACDVKDGAGAPLFVLPNCISKQKLQAAIADKAKLGIEPQYSVCVSLDNGGSCNAPAEYYGTALDDTSTSDKEKIFSEQRQAMVIDSDSVTKNQLEICMKTIAGVCTMALKTVTIKVWVT